MEIIIDNKSKKIEIKKEKKIISMLHFVPSYFVWEFLCDDSFNNFIIIKPEDGVFYDNIAWLMEQNYTFSHPYSSKTDNMLIWLSEHCFNIEDEFQRSITPRLIIERVNDNFAIYYSIPKAEYNRNAIISFAPAGNGFYAKNNKTNLNLQDDMIQVFFNTLESKKIKTRKRKKGDK